MRSTESAVKAPAADLQAVEDFYAANIASEQTLHLVHIAREANAEEVKAFREPGFVVGAMDGDGCLIHDENADRNAVTNPVRKVPYEYELDREAGVKFVPGKVFNAIAVDMRGAELAGQAQALPMTRDGKAVAYEARLQEIGSQATVHGVPNMASSAMQLPVEFAGVRIFDQNLQTARFLPVESCVALYGKTPAEILLPRGSGERDTDLHKKEKELAKGLPENQIVAFKNEAPLKGEILARDTTLIFAFGPAVVKAGSAIIPNAQEPGPEKDENGRNKPLGGKGFSVLPPEKVRLHTRKALVAAATVAK